MHRHVFGIIGLVVALAGAGLVAYDSWVATDPSRLEIAGGGLIRAGILTLAIWLAMPQRATQIPWGRVGAILAAGILMLALRPRHLLVLLPVALAVGFIAYVLRPRPNPSERYRSRARR
jgi:hypothetical protein